MIIIITLLISLTLKLIASGGINESFVMFLPAHTSAENIHKHDLILNVYRTLNKF